MAAFPHLATDRLLTGLQSVLGWRATTAAGMVPVWHEVRLVGHEAVPY